MRSPDPMALRRAGDRLLVVSDAVEIADPLAEHLTLTGHTVQRLADTAAAEQACKRAPPRALFVDMQLPGDSSLALLAELARVDKLPPTLVISDFSAVEVALQAVRLGAVAVIAKPLAPAEVELKLRLALQRPPQTAPASALLTPAPRHFFGMVGACEPMLRLFQQVERVAQFAATVLIQGESGTGKELVARALHEASPRASAPFVAVNCGAIPANLLESELFGHVRGAFTDAEHDRTGLFEAANGGTLFLDEITDLPLPLQVKLLRVLQDGEVRRLGSTKSVAVDVRVAAASAVPARQRVRDGLFREDLFYRLSVIELRLPALRDRLGDLDLLVAHLIERVNRRLGTAVAGLTPAARARLHGRSWPGNVRELKNVIEQACVLAESKWIGADQIALDAAGAELPSHTPIGLDNLSIPLAIEAAERILIAEALQRTAGNRTRAATLLAISPRNLQYKIKQYGIAMPPAQGRPPRLGMP